MCYNRIISKIFFILLLCVFLTLTVFAQSSKVSANKTNPNREGLKQNPDKSERALLAAEFPADRNDQPRFAYPMRDLQIAADVTKAIYTDPILSKYDINFKVKNNRIYLSGKVDMDGVREYAQQVASKVVGVQDVQNDITYYQDSPQDNYSLDMALLENIYERYESSPAVEIENIHITVHNQTVRLSGIVTSNYEKDSAESEAIKAGAKEVYNLLIIGEGPKTREIKNPGDFVAWPY
jgi:osmotically-inducible protein OsmY